MKITDLSRLLLEGRNHRDGVENGMDSNLRCFDAGDDLLLAQRNAKPLVT
jgi:hypothetical protein